MSSAVSSNPIVTLALMAIIPFAVGLAGTLSARRAILGAMIAGWLFLPPNVNIQLAGIPDYNKLVATNLAVFLGCLLFHSKELFSVRLRSYDIPILLWCIAPGISSISNGLGAYDAMSETVANGLMWVLPYWIGRAYFQTAEAMRELAAAVVIGGLVYVPFCFYEIRMSPQLNASIYGFHATDFVRNVRFGGYRPIVFMQSGLMVGTFMASATVISIWLWVSKDKQVLGLPWWLVCSVLLVTTILCKALYAILLLFASLMLLLALRQMRTVVPIALLLLCVPTYMLARVSQLLTVDDSVYMASQLFDADRVQSLETRMQQEEELFVHVADRPIFGWGGWKRSWPVDPETGEYVIRGIDGMWTIAFGRNGLFGLVTMFAVLLMPVVLVLSRFKAKDLNRSEYAAMACLAIALLIFACDSLLNGMFNPIYLLVAGGLSTLSTVAKKNASSSKVSASTSSSVSLDFSPSPRWKHDDSLG